MRIDPLRGYPVVPGSRLLLETFGLVNQAIRDPHHKGRVWRITGFYQPVGKDVRSGLRARVIDGEEDSDMSFVSFINQRDWEVLLGVADPGDWCPWLDAEYVGPADYRWYGFCTDTVDLEDDLQVRETSLREMLRSEVGYAFIPTNFQMMRRVHRDREEDVEEHLYMAGDFDRQSGQYPDMRLETLSTRWVSTGSQRVRWTR